jgi:hypothetical protein
MSRSIGQVMQWPPPRPPAGLDDAHPVDAQRLRHQLGQRPVLLLVH